MSQLQEEDAAAAPKKEAVDILRTRAGGAYIPPAKLRMMQEQMQDKVCRASFSVSDLLWFH